MRIEGWETRLAEVVEAYRHKAFEWGKADCCLFSADAVRAITGVDHAASFRGEYSSEAEAGDIVQELGGIEHHLGQQFEEIPVTMAQRGDVLLYEGALGVCDGVTSWFMTAGGLKQVKTLHCQAAWRVG